MSSTAFQRRVRAIRDMEYSATELLWFVETYSANVVNSQGYHRARRRDLFEKARAYAAAVRRVARLRA